jgi:hypothetical protein
MHCHLWLSPWLHFPDIAILTNSFFHHCVLPEDVKKQNKQELGTIFKTLQLLYFKGLF